MGCAICDYTPCMCGAHDYSHEPSPTCRICDCRPCACSRRDYASDEEMRQRRKEHERQVEENPFCTPHYW